jgi:ABC-type antimicrobial peptide transport system, permease component
VEKDDERMYYEENSLIVTPSFFDVFLFDFIEGSNDGYIAPGSIFIPLSMARKLFGDEPAVGKQILHTGGETQTVMAVYRDLPANTIFNNCIYFAMQEDENKENWRNSNYYGYIRVNQTSNIPLLFDNYKRTFDGKLAWGEKFNWEESTIALRFTALPDVHFVKDVGWDRTPKSSKQTLMILFAIAIVIIAIACINFTNFSTALTPMRIKNINIQRILGARKNTLRLSIASEAVVISVLSYFLAILLIILFNSTPLAKLVDADLSIAGNPLIIGGTSIIVLLAGAFAGLYPSFYITSFAPTLVLKGSFGLSPKGKKLRNILIGTQFIASFALIVGTSFMYLQNHFMQNSPLGYDKETLITVNIERIMEHRDAIINQIKMYAGIEDITYGESLLSSADQYMGWGRRYKGENISFQCIPVHYNFLQVMGIEITKGRDFRAEDANKQFGVFVFNEAACQKYNLELNATIDGQGEIVGFMPDVKFASFRAAVEPMAFYVWGMENWGNQSSVAYIKVKAGTDKRAAMSHIRTTITEFDTEYTYNVRFYEEVLQQLYEKEIALNSLITLFSLISIFISIAGVFGLVVFDSECRRKEIGIRKVLGASVTDILIMFNRAYWRILLICFVTATPLVWYVLHRWLENFAYKTPMYWWVYLLAFVAVGIITTVTVTFQNWRVANDDPVKAIKT